MAERPSGGEAQYAAYEDGLIRAWMESDTVAPDSSAMTRVSIVQSLRCIHRARPAATVTRRLVRRGPVQLAENNRGFSSHTSDFGHMSSVKSLEPRVALPLDLMSFSMRTATNSFRCAETPSSAREILLLLKTSSLFGNAAG